MLLLADAPPRLDAADHGGGVVHPVRDLRGQQAGGRRQGAGPLLLAAEQRELWLEQNGYNRPFLVRYVEWVGNAVRGDFGDSIRFKAPVSDLLWDRLGQHRHPRLVRVRDHDPALAGSGRALRDARGLGAGPKYLVHLDPHHLGAGVRVGHLPGGAVRVQARLAARHLGDDRRLQPGRAGPAGGGAGPLRFRLRRAHDPRLDGRGDDLAIHPHRRAQGPAAARR